MELTVYEGERQVGTLRCETDGLFYDISCELAEERERIRRVFARRQHRDLIAPIHVHSEHESFGRVRADGQP